MDRIKDSGSFDWSSTLHGRTTYIDFQLFTKKGAKFAPFSDFLVLIKFLNFLFRTDNRLRYGMRGCS